MSSANKPEDFEGFIPPHGGYENLLCYQKALVVYDGTRYFCDRFLNKRDRTYDQMVQAARSGKQNILEGSEASGTSKRLKSSSPMWRAPARRELLEDYRDFMRNRHITEWEPHHRYAQRLRRLNRTQAQIIRPFAKASSIPTRPSAPMSSWV